MDLITFALAYIGVLCGVLFRAFVPFFVKLIHAIEAGETIQWQRKYTLILIMNVIISLGVSWLAFPLFDLTTLSEVLGPSSYYIVVMLGFIYGEKQGELITRVTEYANVALG